MSMLQKLDGEILKEIGVGIKNWRNQQKISQIELAKYIGVGRSTIVNIESGKGINLSYFIKILKYFQKEEQLLKIFEINKISPQKEFYKQKGNS